jgi:hypothetical protein
MNAQSRFVLLSIVLSILTLWVVGCAFVPTLTPTAVPPTVAPTKAPVATATTQPSPIATTAPSATSTQPAATATTVPSATATKPAATATTVASPTATKPAATATTVAAATATVASTATSSSQPSTTTVSAGGPSAVCLACHGPFEKLTGLPAKYKTDSGEVINPHRYVPHDSKTVTDCANCHTAHALSPLPTAGSIDLSKVDVTWCYNSCHHQNNFTPCKACHP